MLELRTPLPDKPTGKPDIVRYCEAITELSIQYGITDMVVYVTSPAGVVLSHTNMTTLVAAEGAIRKRINEFKTASKTKPDHEQRTDQ